MFITFLTQFNCTKDTNLKNIQFPVSNDFSSYFHFIITFYSLAMKNFRLNFVERIFIEFSLVSKSQGQFAFVLKISLSILDKINIENTTQMS